MRVAMLTTTMMMLTLLVDGDDNGGSGDDDGFRRSAARPQAPVVGAWCGRLVERHSGRREHCGLLNSVFNSVFNRRFLLQFCLHVNFLLHLPLQVLRLDVVFLSSFRHSSFFASTYS